MIFFFRMCTRFCVMDDESSEEKMVELYRSFLGDGNGSLVSDGDAGNQKKLKVGLNAPWTISCMYCVYYIYIYICLIGLHRYLHHKTIVVGAVNHDYGDVFCLSKNLWLFCVDWLVDERNQPCGSVIISYQTLVTYTYYNHIYIYSYIIHIWCMIYLAPTWSLPLPRYVAWHSPSAWPRDRSLSQRGRAGGERLPAAHDLVVHPSGADFRWISGGKDLDLELVSPWKMVRDE